jgi:hypothetical protein
MSAAPFKPKAYLKAGCPYSFKFLLFMVEAGLGERIEIIRCDPEDPQFEAIKAKLTAKLGKDASFPTVEVEPQRYESDSERLIEHFAAKNGVNADALTALAFYNETIFPQLVKLHERS